MSCEKIFRRTIIHVRNCLPAKPSLKLLHAYDLKIMRDKTSPKQLILAHDIDVRYTRIQTQSSIHNDEVDFSFYGKPKLMTSRFLYNNKL